MIKRYLGILLIVLSLNTQSQEISEINAYRVYNNIINAIGNNNPRPPKVIFKDTKE